VHGVGTSRSAIARHSGKPTTVPSALTSSAGPCRRAGNAARTSHRYSRLSSPATAARPAVTKAGGSCGSAASPTASRVMGSVIANMTTPSAPSSRPAPGRCGTPEGAATERGPAPQGWRFLAHSVAIQAAVATSTPPARG
jgi:hypothetical protein